MTAHAKLSASGAHRWYACPGSVKAEEPFEDSGSEHAREGTAAHTLSEMVLRGEIEDAFAYVGQAIVVDGHPIPVTKSMAQYVQYGYVEYIHEVIDSATELLHLEVEQRVNFSAYVPGGFGTSDAVLLYKDGDMTVLHVVDLKYGHNPVDAENNLQAVLYALGAMDNFEWLVDGEVDEVRLTICQPRVFEEPSTWNTTPAVLYDWGAKLRAVAHQALGPDAPRVPGEDQCKYCKARYTCAARRDKALEIARFDFNEDGDPLVIEGETMPKPDTLTLEDIAKLLPHLGSLIKWANDIQSYAYEQAIRGESVPGFKLVEGGRKTKQWKDEAEVEEFLLSLGLDMDDIYTSKLVSPAQAEKAVGKEKAKALADYYEKVGGKLQLVPEDDKRDAVDVDPAADFD